MMDFADKTPRSEWPNDWRDRAISAAMFCGAALAFWIVFFVAMCGG